jgi:hypothetical protein
MVVRGATGVDHWERGKEKKKLQKEYMNDTETL